MRDVSSEMTPARSCLSKSPHNPSRLHVLTVGACGGHPGGLKPHPEPEERPSKLVGPLGTVRAENHVPLTP